MSKQLQPTDLTRLAWTTALRTQGHRKCQGALRAQGNKVCALGIPQEPK